MNQEQYKQFDQLKFSLTQSRYQFLIVVIEKKMISLFKKTSIHRSLYFGSAFRFTTSFDQHVERNKAILASQIIQKIMNSPLNDYRSNHPCVSLKQSIIQKIEEFKIDVSDVAQQQEITQKVRMALRNYFDNGVWIPKDMCSQIRFDQEAYPLSYVQALNETVEANLETLSSNEIQGLQFSKLSFCPTYLVTGQIFRKIYASSRFLLLTGQYGVGKTYSFILYTLLSEIIFRYRHKYCPDKKMRQLSKGIAWDLPKALYWSVDMSSDPFQNLILSKIIKRQFYEIKKTGFYPDGDIMKPVKEINISLLVRQNFQMRTVLLMDQISEMAAAIRNKNSIKKTSNNLNRNQNNQENNKQYKICQDVQKNESSNKQQEKNTSSTNETPKKYEGYQSYYRILQQLILKNHFDKYMYLSSVDIEKHYLKQLRLMGQSGQSRIEDNTHRISYPISLYSDISVSDTVEFLILLLTKKWKKYDRSQRYLSTDEQLLLQKIKEQLLIFFRKNQLRFLLPLRIKQTIQKYNKFEKSQFHKFQKQGKLKILVEQMVKQIEKKSITDLKEKLKEFITKKLPNQQLQKMKPIILLQLWASSFKVQRKLQLLEHKNSEYDKKQAQQILSHLPLLEIQLNQINVNENMAPAMPSKLFGFEQGKLVCYVSPGILREIFKEYKTNLFNLLLASQERIFKHIKQGSASVNFIQSVFIDILTKGNTSMRFKIKFPGKIQEIHVTKIDPKIGCFIPIPQIDEKSYTNFRFLESFAQYFSKIVNSNSEQTTLAWHLLLPVKKNFYEDLPQINEKGIKNDQINHFSKLVDFALCKYTYSANKGQLQINAFDITVGKKAHRSKIKSFLKQFDNFKDKYQKIININGQQVEVTLNYFVITTIDKKFNSLQFIDQLFKFQQKKTKKTSLNSIEILEKFELIDCEHICKISNPKVKSNRGKKKSLKALTEIQSTSEKPILDYIGVLTMFNNFKVQNHVQGIDLQVKMIERFQQQSKDNSLILENEEQIGE